MREVSKLKRCVRELIRRGYNLAPSSTKDDMPKGAMRILNAAKVQAEFRKQGRVTSEDTGEYTLKRKRGEDKKKAKEADSGEATSSEPAKIRTEADKDAAKAAKAASADVNAKGKQKEKEKGKPEIPKIGPNETLGEYNRRVEALMRGSVNKAIKSAEALKGQQIQALKAEKAARRAAALQGLPPPKPGSTLLANPLAPPKRKEASPSPEPEVKTFAEAPQRRRLNDVALAPPQLPKMRQAKKNPSEIGSKIPLNAGQKRIMEEERERVIKMYRDLKARKEQEKKLEREEKEAEKRRKKKARKNA